MNTGKSNGLQCLNVYHMDRGQSASGVCCGQVFCGSKLIPGQWHKVHLHVELNLPNQKGDKTRFWHDGVLAVDKAVRLRNTNSIGIEELLFQTQRNCGGCAQVYIDIDYIHVYPAVASPP